MFRTRAGRTFRALFVIVGDEVRILPIRGGEQPPVTREDIEPQNSGRKSAVRFEKGTETGTQRDWRRAILAGTFRRMPRTARKAPSGQVYHVLNRSVGKTHLFKRNADFEAFECVMLEAHERHPLRILSYCLLSNEWHFVVWPEEDGQLTDTFRWLAHTHAMRLRVGHRTVGYGHVYQGRFKSFPVPSDQHLLAVLRYVERSPFAAGLVDQAEVWRWGSLWARTHGDDVAQTLLSLCPVKLPAAWTKRVNTPLGARELDRVRLSVERGQPYGTDDWVKGTARELSLEHTLRPEGRPPKRGKPGSGMTN